MDRKLLNEITRAQNCELAVLITGETGVGKEHVADLIQAGSSRKDRPYVKVNCAALPETLIESILFGHRKGAFTDAKSDQTGKFEQADGGTILLDEIGDLPMLAQAKLLRVTQSGQIEKLGGNDHKVDVRLIALTNKSLPEAIAAKTFRSDLYYRIAALEIYIKPLRYRINEIATLAQSFTALPLSESVIAALQRHSWPGNIRELYNIIKRAEIGATQMITGIELEDSHAVRIEAGLRGTLTMVEKEALLEALEMTNYVQKDAADRLGVTPKKVNDLIIKYGIKHDRWRKNS